MSKLKDYCLNITDGEHGSISEDINGTYYLLNNNNITDRGIVINSGDRKISFSDYKKIHKRTKLEKGDVVIATCGTLGKTQVITDEQPNYEFSRSVGIYKCDKTKLLPYFLHYAFMNPIAQKKIINVSKGAVQKHFYIDDMAEFEIDIPSLEKQMQIVTLLKAIDAKISNNNRINAELESMAKTIYDYWFTQFDFPDENGKPYKSSGGKMVWNEELKREIPEGWGVGNLYNIADFINGLACQKFRPKDDIHKLPVIKITEMHDGITENTEYVSDDISEKNIIIDGDILFSWSATLETMIWTGGKAGLNQHIFKVIPKINSKYYVYMQLSAYIINFIQMAEARKTTMGHITTDHLKQSKIVLPPIDVSKRFDDEITVFFEKAISNDVQNRKLASLRDWLLPMLMNGQVGFEGVE